MDVSSRRRSSHPLVPQSWQAACDGVGLSLGYRSSGANGSPELIDIFTQERVLGLRSSGKLWTAAILECTVRQIPLFVAKMVPLSTVDSPNGIDKY